MFLIVTAAPAMEATIVATVAAVDQVATVAWKAMVATAAPATEATIVAMEATEATMVATMVATVAAVDQVARVAMEATEATVAAVDQVATVAWKAMVCIILTPFSTKATVPTVAMTPDLNTSTDRVAK